MAAPSRSKNYRRGLSQDFVEFRKEEMLEILASLKNFPDVSSREMREASETIADEIMVPTIRHEISRHAGNYAPKMNRSVRARRDRIPNVVVGQGRGGPTYSGGAKTVTLRYGTIVGQYRSAGKSWLPGTVQTWAAAVTPGWTKAAANSYTEPTYAAWVTKANEIVDAWNRGATK